jgi:Carbohydrate esterase, sialic acid-specific acetylesterase
LWIYGKQYGFRSILWLQGETDVKALAEKVTPDPGGLPWGSRAVDDGAEYRVRLHNIIRQTRQDLGNVTIPWVVGLTATDTEVCRPTLPNNPNGNASANQIRSGQQAALNNPDGLSQLFLGPDIDIITARRAGDYVHLG